MTRLDKTPVGGYVKLIGRIALQSISPFIVILILLCGFLEAFRNRSVYKDQYKTSSFDTINNFNGSFENSIFKIYSFMVGNLQANDLGLDNLTGPNLVTFGIFIIFLFLIPSLAFNIFTGIAINEIQSQIKECNIQILKDKIDYIYDGGLSIFELFKHFEVIVKFEKQFYGVVKKVYMIKWLVKRMIYCCTKCRDGIFARVYTEPDKKLKLAGSDSKQLDFVDDKYIENFEMLQYSAKNLEERTKRLELKMEERTKRLELKMEERTKRLDEKLNTILEHLKSNE
jgi:hypothetical protein